MATRCPRCSGALVFGADNDGGSRQARCHGCNQFFGRRLSFGEVVAVWFAIFGFPYLATKLLFDVFNPLGLPDSLRNELKSVCLFLAFILAWVLTPILTRKGRRLVPLDRDTLD